MIEHIKGADFEEKISQNDFVIIDFFATWCMPCQALGKVLEDIVSDESSLKIYKIDIDEETDFAIENKVEVVPTIVFYKNKEEVNRIEGFLSKSELLDEIKKYM